MKTTIMLLVSCLLVCQINASIVHDESVNGDLSSDNLSPTSLVFGPGSNQIIGSTTFDPLDRDFLSFTVGPGFQLSQIILQQYNSTAAQQSWFAVESGAQVTSVTNPASLLGSALIGFATGSAQGDDVLDDLGNATLGGSGFTGPLGPGTYSFWYQETGSDTSYELDFIVQAIPEPTSAWLLGTLALATISRRRR